MRETRARRSCSLHVARTRARAAVAGLQENRAGSLLRTTRQDLISQYLRVMGPKLQSITNGAVGTLFDFSRPSPVKRKTAGRLGTDTPTDWFSLMSEHLHLVKAAGSLTLQRKLLSLIMGEIASYGGQVLYTIMDLWRRTPEGMLPHGRACNVRLLLVLLHALVYRRIA